MKRPKATARKSPAIETGFEAPAFASVSLDEKIPRAECGGGVSGKWCEPMEACLNDCLTQGKGLGVETLYGGIGTGRPTPKHHFVVYRKTARDRGVVLIMCPWCGVALRPDLQRTAPAPTVALAEPSAESAS